MTVKELIFTALILLLGEEDKDYIRHERSEEEWQILEWIHRN